MKRILIATTALLAACTSFSTGEAEPPAAASAEGESGGWYPSRYGAEDRLGAMNNLSPEKTAEADDAADAALFSLCRPNYAAR